VQPGWIVCEACRRSLTLLRGPLCARCGAPTAWPVARCNECSGRRIAFASARGAVAYTAAARPLVRAWKERGLRPFATVAAELVVQVVPRPAADLITHIPPDGDRSLRRGHHPAAELARELGTRWGIALEPTLVRTRPVERQAGLSLRERRLNMRRAFTARPNIAPGEARMPRTVVLVDDVYTTGSTVDAAASALRCAGVRTVDVVTFARAIR